MKLMERTFGTTCISCRSGDRSELTSVCNLRWVDSLTWPKWGCTAELGTVFGILSLKQGIILNRKP